MSQKVKKSFENFDQFATALGMIVIILTVIYSDNDYDIWDLAVGILLTWGIIKYRDSFRVTKAHILLARVGLSISIAVILLSLYSLMNWLRGYPQSKIDHPRFLDTDFVISLIVFLFCYFLFLRNPNKK